jgi:hypothetical protein
MVRDAWGQVTPLFPPQASEARLVGHRTLTLPGSPVLQADTGLKDSEIRCIASERELAGALPQLARSAGAGPLSEATVEALDEVVADPRRGRIVMAQLVLRVED